MSRFSYTIVSDVITAVIDSGVGSSVATIPDSVTGIANSVFQYNSDITEVVCTSNSLLEYLSTTVFLYCSNLTSATLGSTLKSIGQSCFYASGLTSITIPEGVTSIIGSAFNSCPNLTSATFNTTLLTILSNGIFRGCPNLSSITLPNSLLTIEDDAFFGCTSLTSITIPDSVTSMNAPSVFYISGVKNITLKTNFINLSGMTDITSVTISPASTSISTNCFYNSGLKSITIPAGVTSMGENAFKNCTSFTSITYVNPTITSLANGLFQNTALESSNIPNGVTSIGNYCFYQCSSILYNSMPNSLTTLGDYAFAESSIGFIELPFITNIGSRAFYNCLNLSELIIYDGVPTIASDAFENTVITIINYNPNLLSLSNIHINTSLLTNINLSFLTTSIASNTFENLNILNINMFNITSIGADAFKNCANLTSINFNNFSSTPIITAGAFNGCTSIANVSLNNIGDFTSVSQLQIPSSLFKNITVNSGTILINFFQELTNLTGITMGGGINAINTDAFKNCTSLTSITFEHNIYYGSPISIDAGAFSGCNAITKLTFSPDIIPTISQLQIQPSLLTNIIIIDNSTIIPTSLFEGLTNLTAVSLPGTLNIIDSSSFKNCTALLNISIPNSVTGLGANSFQNCTSLTNVTIPNSITSINNNTFNGCSSLQEVTISSLNPSIGNYAFANCTTLHTVTTNNLLLFSHEITPSFNNLSYVGPGPYTSIGDYAFYGDLSLNSFVIPESTTSIGAHAFENCVSLNNITIPQDVDVIGIEAFKNCTGLTSVTLNCAGTFTLMSQNSFQNTSSIGATSLTITNLLAQGYTTPQLIYAGFNLSAPLPCFKEDSKILCLVDGVEKEMLVQDIRNGVLVKTSLKGYLPVCMIGTSKINNPDNQDRFVDRLYLCSKDKYPELNEDLVITGCHAILVDDFKEGQREKTMEQFGRIFITDQKYRLIACIDDRATPYGVEGKFNIYHIALENENYYSNYGIYANGLLVESCSKRYLKELSNMRLL